MKGSVMGVYINTRVCFALFFLFCITWFASSDALSCDSCGRECTSACGTKHFRTCCFNYLRKRSSPSQPNAVNDIFVDSDYPGYVLPQKLLNEVLRTEQDLDSFFRRLPEGEGVNLNKKRPQSSDSTVDYP